MMPHHHVAAHLLGHLDVDHLAHGVAHHDYVTVALALLTAVFHWRVAH